MAARKGGRAKEKAAVAAAGPHEGGRSVTLRQVAAKVGLSPATVSLVLNQAPTAAAKMRSWVSTGIAAAVGAWLSTSETVAGESPTFAATWRRVTERPPSLWPVAATVGFALARPPLRAAIRSTSSPALRHPSCRSIAATC